jgi:hypothetical protein
MVETLIGSLLGGIFRCVPEFLKWLDRKDERKHELSMQDKAIEFQKIKGDQKIEEITTQGQQEWNTGALDALKTAIQGQETLSGIKWIDGWSKLIRPAMATQWVLILYPAVILAGFFLAIQSGVPALDALVKVFGPDEKALVGAIVNFWLLSRVFDKVK